MIAGETRDRIALLPVGVAPPNSPPVAQFTSSCGGLMCAFTDTSTDSDGTVTAWSWNFGDGTGSTARNPSHSYGAGGTYTVTLIVTDNAGAQGTISKPVTVDQSGLQLSARGCKVKGLQTVDLAWSGAGGGSVDVWRDGVKITTTANDGAYTDNLGRKGSGTYVYKVCETSSETCSNNAVVVF